MKYSFARLSRRYLLVWHILALQAIGKISYLQKFGRYIEIHFIFIT